MKPADRARIAVAKIFLRLRAGLDAVKGRIVSPPAPPVVLSNQTLSTAILDYVSDFITLLDRNGTILYESPSVERSLGYRPEEIIGRNVFDFVHSEDLPLLLNEFSRGVRIPGFSADIECRFRHKDGSWRALEVYGRNLLEDPAVGSVVVTSRDVTDRRRAEREKTMRSYALRSVSEAVSITDLEGTILFVNAAFLRLHGCDEDEILGRSVAGIFSPRHPAVLTAEILRASSESGWEGEVYHLRKDGTEFPVSLSSTAIRDEQNDVIALIQVARDVSDRKRAEEVLRESEQKYHALFSNVLDGVYQSTPDGKLLTVNPAMVRMLGFGSEAELLALEIGKDLYVDPEDRRRWLEQMERKGIVQSTEMKLRRKDGSLIVCLDSAHTVRNEKGEVLYFEGTLTDITERKRAEDALRESEERYRRFFEDDLTGDYISTPSGRILECNPAFARIFGYDSVEEALAAPARDYYAHPEERLPFLERLRREKRLDNVETVARRKDGKLVYVVENIIGTFDEAGRLVQFKGYLFDNTERKKLEEDIRQAQKMESIGTLAGGVAHDFNNILAIIMAYASRARRGEQDAEKTGKALEAILKAVDRGAGMVRQLLTFARRADIHFESVDVNEVVRDLVKLLHETFPRTITCDIRLPERLPHITADRNQLNQALLNLCVNARDAMPEGGEIAISTATASGEQIREFHSTARDGTYVCLSVKDTGVGMSPETLERIFEPFFTTKERGQGTGLGLAVVYGIVQSHGGYLRAESVPGHGTTFCLYFPVAPERLVAGERAEASPEQIPGGSETVLVAEDEDYLREQVVQALTEKGYRVLLATDGQQAVEVFDRSASEIALVVMDMGLPKLAGWEALKRILQRRPDVPCIAASGFFDPVVRSEMTARGLQHFLQKPYLPDELLLRIRAILDAAPAP